MNLDSVEAVKNMVQLGLGISLLPRSGVRRELELGSLTRIGLREVQPVLLPTYLLLRRGQQHGATVTSLLRLLQDIYGVEIPVEAFTATP